MVRQSETKTLYDIVQAISIRREYHVPLNAPYIMGQQAAVQVMTAHKSKGLEFAMVYLPYLTDSTWGGSKRSELFSLPLVRTEISEAIEPLDDERRLLFVAITRAKTMLQVSSSEQNQEGREQIMSRLWTEIDEQTYSVVPTDTSEANFSPLHKLTDTIEQPSLPEETVLALFATRGFSATSFNNYLETPWKYVVKNLLRVPEVQGLPLLYGTAVHNVLEYLTRRATSEGTLPPVTELNTQKISVAMPTGIVECPEVLLTGKLDRIDLAENAQAVRVVDYKTGKPKTRNAIEGNTKTSDGGYKRQLVFYALLLDLYDKPELRTRDMVLSFVEPSANGRITEEVFTITDAEVEALKGEIIAAVQTFVDGSWVQAGDAEAAEPYRALLQ
jgi:DNA helicase-2/ATP-dependent DNA helicase PcrA